MVDHVRESQRAVASCANESQDAVDAIGDRRKTDSFRELDLSNAFCHPDVPLLNAFFARRLLPTPRRADVFVVGFRTGLDFRPPFFGVFAETI